MLVDLTVLLGLRSRFTIAFGVVQVTAAIVLVPAVAALVASGSDDPVRDVFVVLAAAALLTKGGFDVMSSRSLELSDLRDLVDIDLA